MSLTKLEAQTSNYVFQYTSPPPTLGIDQTKIFNYLSSLAYKDTLYYLQLSPNIEDQGYVSMNLPDGNVSFKIQDILFDGDTSFTLIAYAPQGNLSLYKTSTAIGGTITLDSTVYALYPFGTGLHVLMKYDVTNMTPGDCAVADSAFAAVSGEIAMCGTTCDKTYVDVLAMVTPDARLWLNSHWGIYANWYLYAETHNFNTAMFNSEVGGKRIRVRIIDFEPNFAYDPDHDIDKDTKSLGNSFLAQYLTDYYKCDIGVMLTDRGYWFYDYLGYYHEVYGNANSLNPNTSNKFCIVETPFIDPIRYTFAHEVAHQYGCLHENDFENSTGCPHGKVLDFGSYYRYTIMARAPHYGRIPYFSNPDVSYMGVSTGEINLRDNAHQINSQAFCKVEDNKNLTIFEAKIETGVVCTELPLTLDADVQYGFFTPPAVLSVTPYGVGPYQYEWHWSMNGSFNPSYYLGNTSSIYLPQPPNCPAFYVSLKVTSADGYVSFVKKRIVCDQNCPRSSDLASDVSNTGFVYPNPTSGEINIPDIDGESVIKAGLFDLTGKLMKTVEFNTLEKSKTINFDELNNGLYFIRLRTANNSFTEKLIIAR